MREVRIEGGELLRGRAGAEGADHLRGFFDCGIVLAGRCLYVRAN